MSHLEKMYLFILPILKLNCLFFVIALCYSYTLDIISLFDRWFSKMFSHSVVWCFVLLIIHFAVQMPLSLMQSHLLICCLHFWCHIQKITANIDELLPYIFFSLGVLWFQVLCLNLSFILN